jgi:hypothetical protein
MYVTIKLSSTKASYPLATAMPPEDTVSAPITGKLVRLSLEAGDRVKKDMTVVANIKQMAPAFLDVRVTRELKAQLEAAKAAVALAEAEIHQAAGELKFAQSELRGAHTRIKRPGCAHALPLDQEAAGAAGREASLHVPRLQGPRAGSLCLGDHGWRAAWAQCPRQGRRR